ncbi:DcaP family trimeric outer membrane transporter [Acinetobacter sp. ANC 5502]
MKGSTNFLFKSALGFATLIFVSPTYAAVTEEQIAKLEQEIQELKVMMQKQKEADQEELAKVKKATSASPLNLTHMTTKGGAEFEFYGNIRADATYQVKGPSAMFNNISTVPLEHTAAETNNADKFQSSLNATRLGFNFKAPTSLGHDIGGKIEMDFLGGGTRDTFRIRHAYITYDHWLIGQTWSNFNAVEYFPETVDAALSVGGSLTRISQLKYSNTINPHMNFAVSLEDPKPETVTTTGTQNFQTDPNAKLKLPSLTGRLNYKFDNGSVVSGRAFVTQKATTYGNHDEFIAWGVGLGGKIQLTPTTLLRADYNHIFGDTKNLLWTNYAYVFDKNGDIKPNEFDAVTVGLTQQFTPKIRSSISLGYMRANTNNSFSRLVHDDHSQNKQLIEGWINAFYNPVKPINIGIEYMYGQRQTFDNKDGLDNRINATIIYDF